jgi:hypothetical protein
MYYIIDNQFYVDLNLILAFFKYLFQNNTKKITFAELISEAYIVQ